MKKNIVWYIGFIISIVGLVLLWRSYGIAAWLMGVIVSFGTMLEISGYD